MRFGRNKIKSLTMGIGFSWRDISLDYAFLNEPRSSGLGATHLISLSIDSDLIIEYLDKNIKIFNFYNCFTIILKIVSFQAFLELK